MNTEISNISLTREDYINTQEIINRYININNAYKSKKSEVRRLKNEISNKGFLFFKNNNQNKIELADQFKKEMNLLSSQKYVLYLEIRNIVKNIIANKEEYNHIYNKYLEYLSTNEEVYSINKPYLDLIKRKPQIDKFFDKLKDCISNNIKVEDDKVEKYKYEYKNIMKFLSHVYSVKNNKTKKDIENFDLSEDLNLNDSYAILSIISIVYTIIINPVFNSYKDAYKEFMQKKEFINDYNEKINELTTTLIKSMSSKGA